MHILGQFIAPTHQCIEVIQLQRATRPNCFSPILRAVHLPTNHCIWSSSSRRAMRPNCFLPILGATIHSANLPRHWGHPAPGAQ
eukprot:1161625-Pelagomonas_calceolata.AAC.27